MLHRYILALLAISACTAAQAASVSLIGTELSLETHGQATPTSELFVASFPATAVVSATSVEFPDVESLFDPSVGVPPGFANSLVNVAIDAGADYIEIDFANSAPSTRFATGYQNTYVFTFESSAALTIVDAVIDTSVTTLGLTDDRVTFSGSDLFVNVQSLPFDTSTFARINLTAVPLPSALILFGSAVFGIFGLTRRKKSLP